MNSQSGGSVSFRLLVKNAGCIKTIGRHYLDVVVETGSVRGDEVAVVDELPGRSVSITSVALVGGGNRSQGSVTLAIEQPTYPIEELVGCHLSSQGGPTAR